MTSTIGFLLQDIEEHDLWGAVALNELHSKVPAKKKDLPVRSCVCVARLITWSGRRRRAKSLKSPKKTSPKQRPEHTGVADAALNSGCLYVLMVARLSLATNISGKK